MQYIKNYSLSLYNLITALQKQERRKTLLQRIINRAKRKWNNKKPSQEHIDEIINIACEFMNIDKDEYYKIIEKFNNGKMEEKVSWNNIDKEWLCLNIYVQSILYNSVIPIYTMLMELPLSNSKVLDYGCGTGTLAILLHKSFNFKELVLADIDNYVASFVKFYITKTNSEEIVWKNISENHNDEVFDFVQCFDVLEHLENSYEHLLKLNSKVRSGGMLALKIAFECEDQTHLPQAAESFFVKNDGLGYLKQKYRRVRYFGGGIVSGVYKKL
jgi:2-polyprenyl-3-methyl-5-hydroxy-6-metoxy-1,4-benzoquinol methylase